MLTYHSLSHCLHSMLLLQLTLDTFQVRYIQRLNIQLFISQIFSIMQASKLVTTLSGYDRILRFLVATISLLLLLKPRLPQIALLRLLPDVLLKTGRKHINDARCVMRFPGLLMTLKSFILPTSCYFSSLGNGPNSILFNWFTWIITTGKNLTNVLFYPCDHILWLAGLAQECGVSLAAVQVPYVGSLNKEHLAFINFLSNFSWLAYLLLAMLFRLVDGMRALKNGDSQDDTAKGNGACSKKEALERKLAYVADLADILVAGQGCVRSGPFSEEAIVVCGWVAAFLRILL